MEHYFSEKQTSPFKVKEMYGFLRGKKFYFYTAPGVFSKSKVDRGTRFLINNATIKNTWKVLDLGCGYGIAGIVIKKLFPDTEVVLSDVNERALKLVGMNAHVNKVSVKIVKSFSFNNIAEFFNTILFNPPQAAGLKLCYKMILESKEHLMIDGLLQLVARHKKGGSRFEQYMLKTFGNVESIKGKKYRIYISRKHSEHLPEGMNNILK